MNIAVLLCMVGVLVILVCSSIAYVQQYCFMQRGKELHILVGICQIGVT